MEIAVSKVVCLPPLPAIKLCPSYTSNKANILLLNVHFYQIITFSVVNETVRLLDLMSSLAEEDSVCSLSVCSDELCIIVRVK